MGVFYVYGKSLKWLVIYKFHIVYECLFSSTPSEDTNNNDILKEVSCDLFLLLFVILLYLQSVAIPADKPESTAAGETESADSKSELKQEPMELS